MIFDWFKKDQNNDEWRFFKDALDPKIRKVGISGFMRLRNEEEFLPQAIESHIGYLDELILVYNRCNDRTPEICRYYEKRFPEKIRCFHYLPFVYPQGSKEHKTLPPDSPQSLVNYYNYALSRTSRAVAVKIDGDHIAIPGKFSEMAEKIRVGGLDVFLTFYGVNLWDHGGKMYVNGNRPLTSGFDTGFFPVSKKTYFKHHPTFEVFSHKLEIQNSGIAFFHAKSLKKDRGFGVYDLDENPGSEYFGYIKMYYEKPKIIEWADFVENEKSAAGIPHPSELGITPLLNRP